MITHQKMSPKNPVPVQFHINHVPRNHTSSLTSQNPQSRFSLIFTTAIRQTLKSRVCPRSRVTDDLVSRSMSDLTARLKAVQAAQEQEVQSSLDHLTLPELENEVISFGEAHMGHTFSQAWADQEWVKFMTTRYRKSSKESHMRFLKYVELKIEAAEAEMQQRPMMPKAQGYAIPKAKCRPKAMPAYTMVHHGDAIDISSQAGGESVVSETEMYDTMTMNAQLEQQETMHALQTRMLNMEDALQKVIHHLEITQQKND
jgi:hypothetical protein